MKNFSNMDLLEEEDPENVFAKKDPNVLQVTCILMMGLMLIQLMFFHRGGEVCACLNNFAPQFCRSSKMSQNVRRGKEFFWFLEIRVYKITSKNLWDCGGEENIGGQISPLYCAAACRERYSKEAYFSFGRVGGSKEYQCLCERGDNCNKGMCDDAWDMYSINVIPRNGDTFTPCVEGLTSDSNNDSGTGGKSNFECGAGGFFACLFMIFGAYAVFGWQFNFCHESRMLAEITATKVETKFAIASNTHRNA